jgi:hypothetical protein
MLRYRIAKLPRHEDDAFPRFAGSAAPVFSVPATLFFAFPKKGMFHLVLLKVGTIFNAW